VVFLGLVPLPRLSDPVLAAELETDARAPAFLRIARLRMRIGRGEAFLYDAVTREAMDAVVMAAHFERGGRRHVMLCSAIRPPLFWRDVAGGSAAEAARAAVLWELPAGLVEPGESFRHAAARELWEELGARVAPEALAELGPRTLPAPGIIAEVHAYFHVAIDPDGLSPPPGDSSALERAATVASLPLDEALALCASGAIRDAKTELALRRLAELG
jgi:ADP-ribose pyrophosphatase